MRTTSERVLAIPSQAVALIAALMLRGPQTVGELRINCDRLHRFADTSAVEGFLHELAARPAGALAVELPRQPGARETRWTHLLSGAPAVEIPRRQRRGPRRTSAPAPSELAALRASVARLEADVAELAAGALRVCVTRPRDTSERRCMRLAARRTCRASPSEETTWIFRACGKPHGRC